MIIRPNNSKQIENGRKLLRQYGSWSNVRANAVRGECGRLLVRLKLGSKHIK